MVNVRIVDREAFSVAGRQVYIGGQDNELFGRFWQQCQGDGFIDRLHHLRAAAGLTAGPQTGGVLLGVSRVEADPSKREFYYMIATELPDGALPQDLECYQVPAGRWAIFTCQGPMPGALVTAEMYAFMQWLPESGYRHAAAPEMEVYPPTDEAYCEFWLPLVKSE